MPTNGERTHVAAGVPLRVRVSGDGPVLLLLGGLGAPMQVWEQLVPWLPGRRLVRFDPPGVGGTPTPRLPLPLRRVARAAVALLDELGVARFDVLGVSMGGGVAQEVVRAAPHRVRRLVLVSTSCGWAGVPMHPAAALALARIDRFTSPRRYRALAPRLVGGRTAVDEDALRRYTAAMAEAPRDTKGYVWQLASAASWTSAHWLHRIRCPVLVLHGDADPLVPAANARLLAARLSDAQLVLVPGGGHLVLFDTPEVAVPAVRRFLESDGPATARCPA
ncbi:alpha/beta fold hydrolase [Pseudonocardia thermophila]|jgi:Predicted hydrolases or acyltransferases (alpha/beta hydrolase superfamily)|uniref:alpha/beta fold hydrolase n=1 Tax=Pseudonocardia thermophila TaxID=1848 RepID=UPI00248E032B|nr:alpha/beta fold hydrolase [Pseudonocardia thermophila]